MLTLRPSRSVIGALILTLVATASLSSEAAAQRRRPLPNRKPVVRAATSLRTIVARTERESNALRNSFERDYAKYHLNRLPAGERSKENVQELDQAFERLRGVTDDANPARARDEMRKVLREAEDVDRIFGNHPEIVVHVRNQWCDLREDVNRLARIYGLPGLGRTGSKRR